LPGLCQREINGHLSIRKQTKEHASCAIYIYIGKVCLLFLAIPSFGPKQAKDRNKSSIGGPAEACSIHASIISTSIITFCRLFWLAKDLTIHVHDVLSFLFCRLKSKNCFAVAGAPLFGWDIFFFLWYRATARVIMVPILSGIQC